MSHHPLPLVHIQVNAEERSVVIIGNIEDTLLGIQELGHVAGEIHCLTVLDRSGCNVFDTVNRKIDIEPVMPVINVPVIVDFIDLVILSGRVIHQHHIIVIERLSDEFLIE